MILLGAISALAQRATVKRNVFLRSDSSKASQALKHLHNGATVTLLVSTNANGQDIVLRCGSESHLRWTESPSMSKDNHLTE